MLYSTPASKKRQQSSVNSRLDFDATHAAANLIASQAHMLPAAAPAAQRRADAVLLAGVSPLKVEPASRESVQSAGNTYASQRTATGHETDTAILICAELARIAIALHFGLVFRIWLILLQLSRETNQTGFTRAEIEAALIRYHVKFNRRNLTRWLADDALFWTYDIQTQRYYHRGYLSLSEYLVGLCESKGLHALYLTNFPGQRRPMLLNIGSDNLKQFERNVYSAWTASRENPMISRLQLVRLWNRTSLAIRAWEGEGGVQPQTNYTFTDEIHHDAIPRQLNGAWRPDVHRTTLNGRDVVSWQLPNRYLAPPLRQHPHKGQLRRIHTSMVRYIDTMKAAGVCEQGLCPGGLNLNVRRYHASTKGAKESCKRHGLRPRYVFKGRWGDKHGYYEYAPDGRGVFDYFTCRRVFRREQIVCLTKREKFFVGGSEHPF